MSVPRGKGKYSTTKHLKLGAKATSKGGKPVKNLKLGNHKGPAGPQNRNEGSKRGF